MDGFEPIPLGLWRSVPSATVPGGLQIPDLDAPARRPDPVPEPDSAQLAAELHNAALRDAERQGFAAGEAAGRAAAIAEHERALAMNLAAITARLDALQGEAAQVSEATAATTATALARVLLAALDAALPAAAARVAEDSVLTFAASLRPILHQVPHMHLAVAPGLAEACAAKISDARVEVTEDPALPPGDAQATWRGGGASLSLDDRRQAAKALLATFGLTEHE